MHVYKRLALAFLPMMMKYLKLHAILPFKGERSGHKCNSDKNIVGGGNAADVRRDHIKKKKKAQLLKHNLPPKAVSHE